MLQDSVSLSHTSRKSNGVEVVHLTRENRIRGEKKKHCQKMSKYLFRHFRENHKIT